MFVWFDTFGCKVNQYETELLRQSFERIGNTTVHSIREADLCVVNSCTVTAQSDFKLRQLMHKVRRENPSAIIALCGCYPQAFNHAPNAVPEADIILGNSNKSSLPEYVDKFLKTGKRIIAIPADGSTVDANEALSAGSNKTRGIIKIQDGCDRFCSYCIIPYARGRSHSKCIADIETEAKALVKSGHKELVVVGINLSDYGKGSEYDLADAIEVICKSGAARIRLGSLEPEELTEDIVTRLSALPNLCPHFHLALQSGCDKTLNEMRRKYDKAYYLTLVNLLQKHFPNCAITTDIMVGFPGETDENFAESLEFVKRISFADAHIFPYSPREGTVAAKREDQITLKVKEQRAHIMSEVISESRREYQQSLVGSVQQVMFEREKSPDFHQGHSANYQLVKVKRFTNSLFRELLDVRITAVEDNCLIGEIVQR